MYTVFLFFSSGYCCSDNNTKRILKYTIVTMIRNCQGVIIWSTIDRLFYFHVSWTTRQMMESHSGNLRCYSKKTTWYFWHRKLKARSRRNRETFIANQTRSILSKAEATHSGHVHEILRWVFHHPITFSWYQLLFGNVTPFSEIRRNRLRWVYESCSRNEFSQTRTYHTREKL